MVLITTKSTPTPHSGSETSSRPDTSPAATLTSGQSQTCDPTISAITPRPISSPVSADGRSLSDLRDGPMIDLFGQVHVPASPLVPPARARRPMTSATFGLRGYLSSPSVALQSSLESRLKRRLDGAGSILFALTWRVKGTPAGRPYCQLAASARPISETGFGSWPTPMAGTPAQKGYNEAGNTDSGRKTVALAMWPTPNVPNGGRSRAPHTMSAQASLTASGMTPNGSTAQTEKPGQLDPDHSRWVMGYSVEHLNCAPTETPSFLKSQRNLSWPP